MSLLSPTQQHQLVLLPTQGVALDIVISDSFSLWNCFCLSLKRGYNFKGAETEDNIKVLLREVGRPFYMAHDCTHLHRHSTEKP